MSSTSPEGKAGPAMSGAFCTTHWSLILQAGCEFSPDAQRALEWLCQSYRYPLYVHVRRLGWGPEDAEDLTQHFLARFIERRYFQLATPQRGRFRSFLLTSLKHFLADEWDRLRAQKRGGSHAPVCWDGLHPEERYRLEPVDALSPDRAYEKRWAATLLETVLGRLQAEYESAGRLREFEILKNFVWGDRLAGSYAAVAPELNMNENSMKVAVHRLRKHFRELLRQEVLRTVASPEEVDEELRHLRLLLSS